MRIGDADPSTHSIDEQHHPLRVDVRSTLPQTLGHLFKRLGFFHAFAITLVIGNLLVPRHE